MADKNDPNKPLYESPRRLDRRGGKAIAPGFKNLASTKAFEAGQEAEMFKGTKYYGKKKKAADAKNTLDVLQKGGSWKKAAKKAALRDYSKTIG